MSLLGLLGFPKMFRVSLTNPIHGPLGPEYQESPKVVVAHHHSELLNVFLGFLAVRLPLDNMKD